MFTELRQLATMSATQTQTQARLPSMARRILGHPLLAPLNDASAWNRVLSPVHSAFSLTEPQAQVVRVDDEVDGIRSLWLRPNRRFKGFMPGQHLLLTLEVGGSLQSRCFSLSRQPRADRLLRLTIRAKVDGVSAATHRLRVGATVRISQALGDFTTPASGPLLLISAGSGVTPMLSILHDLAATAERDVCVVHCATSQEQMLAADELRKLAQHWPSLELHLHASNDGGRLDGAQLALYVPDWEQREAMLCGPSGFMQMIQAHYHAAGRASQLRYESFGELAQTIDSGAESHAIRYGNPAQAFTANAGQSLLNAAENAGLTPRFGCRRGICRTCQCRKRSGLVRNLLTKQVSSPGSELIQLCISTPLSAVELDGQTQRTA